MRAALAAVSAPLLAGAGCATVPGGPASGAATSGPATADGSGPGNGSGPGLLAPVEVALGRLTDAYARGDRAAWIAAARPPAGDAHAGEDYDLMRAVGVTDLAYGSVRVLDGSVASSMSYRLAGIDQASATAETRWDPLALPPARIGAPAVAWEEPGAVGLRSTGAVVLAAVAPPGGAATAAELLTHAEAAAATVGRIWGGSPPALVLTLPREEATFALWAAEAGGMGEVSAVTVGPVQEGRAIGCDRIVVHPGTWRELSPEGRRVVITHEATHVALRRDAGGSRPLWLEEGYCEYVAYAGASLPESTLVAPLLRQVRRSGVPARLPEQAPPRSSGPGSGPGARAGGAPGAGDAGRARSSGSVDGAGMSGGAGGSASAAPAGYADAPTAYAAGLLACRLIAERAGEAALTRCVGTSRGASQDPGVTGPLREATGWTPADLHRAWSARVRALVDG